MKKNIAAIFESFRNSSVASRLIGSEMSVNSLRTNGLLRKEEWVELDTRVVGIARDRLVGIEDLRSRGLTVTLGGLGTLISQYEADSDMTPAELSMDGVKPGQEDDIVYDLRSVPVPIIHKDFRLNIRRLEASRRLGEPIDTTQAQVASRRVADGAENLLFNGSTLVVDGNRIYGYTTHPARNIGLAIGPWSSIAYVYETALAMVAAAREDNMFGPYVLYISKDQWQYLFAFYADGSGQTPIDRIKKIEGISDVKTVGALADNTAVLVQMTTDVVDLAVAQDIVTVEWDSQGGMVVHFKVMTVLVPRIKSDYDGRSGIVHFTGLDGSGSGS